ncbi:hypothetical protein KQI84_11445 [bacterium]|nr:hypothetical protein [bacterium]
MAPIGSREIWFDTFPQLAVRWFRRQPKSLQEEIGSSAEASLRAEERVRTLIRYGRIKPSRALKTPREWEVWWDASEEWARLRRILTGFGWGVVRHRGDASRTEVLLDAQEESDLPVVVIVERILQEQARIAVDGGLNLPLKADDLAPMALSRELFQVIAEKIGSAPSPWVDELAQFEFSRVVLGLPFHPMVLWLLKDGEK